MNSHLTVLTGASRGLGLALTQQLLARGHRVLALSRKPVALQAPPGSELLHWACDLADAEPVAQRLAAWLRSQDPNAVASATLINNAGVVSQLVPLADVPGADLINALRVGLEAPALLTSAFLNATAGWAAPRKVLLISSGLGRRAMASSASYCAAKAGLDHLARAVALEGVPIVSLAPGVIDTDMQVQLRGADPAQFADRGRFVDLKAQGQLDSPEAAAAKVLRYLDRADFGHNPVADVRDS